MCKNNDPHYSIEWRQDTKANRAEYRGTFGQRFGQCFSMLLALLVLALLSYQAVSVVVSVLR